MRPGPVSHLRGVLNATGFCGRLHIHTAERLLREALNATRLLAPFGSSLVISQSEKSR